MNTQTLRQQLREIRRAISLEQRAKLSQKATDNMLSVLERLSATKIATFLSMPEEIDTSHLNQALLEQQKELYLPYVQQKNHPLAWVLFSAQTDFSHDAMGIAAPNYDPQLTLPAHALDVVLTPLVGFDKTGNRMGMGGGYYDRSFAFRTRGNKPYLLGFAFECQRVDTLSVASWDVPLDGIITEENVVLFSVNL